MSVRNLPSVDRLLREPALAGLSERYSRGRVVEGARELLSEWRERARRNGECSIPPPMELAAELGRRLDTAARPALRRAINASGVIVHTNLGRAPLSAAALAAMA